MDKDLKKEMQSYPDNWDFSLSGKRIQLIKKLIDDPYTKLKPNDLGTIEYVIKNNGLIEDQISIQWDSGSNLMLLIGIDQYIILDEVGVIENE